jgi:hypothetical protein
MRGGIEMSCNLLAIDKHSALYLFESAEEAESWLEAIDVQQEAFEFCDVRGQRYAAAYTTSPKVSRLSIDVGAFRLVSQGTIDSGLPERFVERAAHLEHSCVLAISSVEALRNELRKRA